VVVIHEFHIVNRKSRLQQKIAGLTYVAAAEVREFTSDAFAAGSNITTKDTRIIV
jgi:hypothetical protein